VLAVRLTDRAGKGIRNSPRDALIADSIDETQRGLAFGLHRAGDTAGAALGLLIALLVVAFEQRLNTQLSPATFRTLVAISIVPALLAVVVLIGELTHGARRWIDLTFSSRRHEYVQRLRSRQSKEER